ncbi:alpha/beta hydrolase [Pseudonocardia yuanmonensis]|uniref:Alpha/beta hydrolase n=1 Tax=Pseudonocardia yuanmonensis TaxID=1095914 RepID=A0ABP8W4V5_9PSEU
MVRRGASVLVLSVLAVLGTVAVECAAPAAGSAAGDWQGTVEVPGAPLPVGVHLTEDGRSGTIDIPSQGIAGKALSGVGVDGTAVSFAIPDVPGDPTFRGTLDGDAIRGDLTQSGRTFAFSLTRGTLPVPARPQTPAPPFPYRSEDVTFPSGGLTLAGTVTTPEGPGPFPAVVMITGSGAQDRDETLAGHKPFLVPADVLTRAGVAVLRTDDRGVGGSGGSLDGTPYADLADDARAGVAYLRTRPDVDPARIGLFGHSEGGYLAPLAVQRSAPGEIAFTVLMAGPAVPGGDVLVEQNRLILTAAGLPADQVEAQVERVGRMIAQVRAGDVAGAQQTAREQAVAQGLPAEQADAAAAQVPSLVPFLTDDPRPALSALRIPVLAFFGSKDLQVPPAQNEQPMRDALAGSPDATVRTFDGLNHLLQPAPTGSPAEYAMIETTIDPAVLEAVTTWLNER